MNTTVAAAKSACFISFVANTAMQTAKPTKGVHAMSVFDIATAQFDGFSPKNIVVLPGGKKNGAEPLVYFVNEYRSQNYVHVRTIYQGNDERWRMGKGISMLEADAAPLFAALGAMVEKPASVPQTKRAVKVK